MMLDSRFNKDYMCVHMGSRLALTTRSDIDQNTDANVWRGRARFGAQASTTGVRIAVCGEGITDGTVLLGYMEAVL